MRKEYIIVVLMLTVNSCKKENREMYQKIKKENYSPTEYFSFPTNIKKWRNFTEVSINDSVKKVAGVFENYKIEGFLNQYNQKINWWRIINKKDIKADNVQLEYRIVDDKEYVNQYINYDIENGADLASSLFYVKEKLSTPYSIRYKFFTPNSQNKINSSATTFLTFYLDNKEIKNADLKCLKKDNYYYVDIKYNPVEEDLIVKGLFKEGYEYRNGEMGINDIYILDTIK